MRAKKLTQWYLMIAAIVVGFIVYVALTYTNIDQDCYQWDEIIQLNDGWIYEDENGKQTPVDLPIGKKTKADTTYTLIRRLPNDLGEGSVLCFKSDHLLINAYVQNELVYSLQVDNHTTIGKSPGFTYVFIPLMSDMAGQFIRIEYIPVYSNNSYHISDVTLGDHSTIITGIIRDNSFAILICSLTFCFGLIFIVFYLIKKKAYEMSKSLLYLGIFALPLSIWSITETQIMQFFFSNVYALQYVTYLSLSLCPLPFLLYYNERNQIRESKLFMFVGSLCCINAFIALALQSFGIAELPETLFLAHLSIAGVFIFILFDAIRNFKSYRNRMGKCYSLTCVSMVILLICCMIDLYRFYTTKSGDYAKHVRVGFLLFLGCTGLKTIIKSVQIDKENRELEQLAYADISTGLWNQSALKRDTKELEERDPFSIVLIEVLGLEEIMNNHGTREKDELLMSVGNILGKAFHSCGRIYRVSEGLFVIILSNSEESDYHNCMSVVEKRVHNSNKSRSAKVELHSAYTVYNRENGQSIQSILEELEHSLRNMKNKKN